MINLNVKFDNCEKPVKFVVVGNGGPPLLGRNFLRVFNFGISKLEQDIHFVSENGSVELHKELDKLLSKHEELFSTGLGKFNVRKKSVEMENNAKPIFFKARPIPFKWKEMMDDEIKRLISLQIITPCSNTEWGTPMVPILKPDGTLRLCAVTIK